MDLKAAQGPILVTGTHRSGSTWVGRMLASHPMLAYVHEPLNLDRATGLCAAPVQYFFPYICLENEVDYYPAVRKTIEFHFDLNGQWKNLTTPKAVGRMCQVYLQFARYRKKGARPLIKDPMAFFAAPWLSNRFNMQVVVLIRHPAAFASSLKLLNWHFPFSHLLDQRLLMRDYLAPFEESIKEQAAKRHDLVDQAALVWNIFHSVIQRYRGQYGQWIFLRHEDLSQDPMTDFARLLNRLGLDFPPEVVSNIREHCFSADTGDKSRSSPFCTQRDSVSNVRHWKSRLTSEEITRLRRQVEPVAASFYSDKEW